MKMPSWFQRSEYWFRYDNRNRTLASVNNTMQIKSRASERTSVDRVNVDFQSHPSVVHLQQHQFTYCKLFRYCDTCKYCSLKKMCNVSLAIGILQSVSFTFCRKPNAFDFLFFTLCFFRDMKICNLIHVSWMELRFSFRKSIKLVFVRFWFLQADPLSDRKKK